MATVNPRPEGPHNIQKTPEKFTRSGWHAVYSDINWFKFHKSFHSEDLYNLQFIQEWQTIRCQTLNLKKTPQLIELSNNRRKVVIGVWYDCKNDEPSQNDQICALNMCDAFLARWLYFSLLSLFLRMRIGILLSTVYIPFSACEWDVSCHSIPSWTASYSYVCMFIYNALM